MILKFDKRPVSKKGIKKAANVRCALGMFKKYYVLFGLSLNCL